MRLSLWVVVLLLVVACGEDKDPDIVERLRAIDGLTVTEQPTQHAGYRFFLLDYVQPADHNNADGAQFSQQMSLLHRSASAPVVLYSGGYFLSPTDGRRELTLLLGANQLSVEHRWFEPSRPAAPDWSLLNIEQAAADHHRIIEALRPMYGGSWVSTGVSKGGMTSVYHRRFHPDDVDATVAYVAPLSIDAPDTRYIGFLEQVGSAGCRQALIDVQQEFLTRRASMTAMLQQVATTDGLTYATLGMDLALEHAVLDMPFAFWQYRSANDCPSIPPVSAADGEIFDFVNVTSFLGFYSDSFVDAYEPYYYQAATQLGFPLVEEGNLTGLLNNPGTQGAQAYVSSATAVYDGGSAMTDIANWVSTSGERLLFVYGGADPWTAGAFQLGGATDSFLYTAPDGNHGTQILDLPNAEVNAALDAIERWTGVSPDLSVPSTTTVSPRSRLRPL